MNQSTSLSKVFGALSREGLTLSRADANKVLKDFIEHTPEFFASYVAFEPNAYDGKDAQFVNAPGHDATGRFIPYWTRNAQGGGNLEPLTDYDKEGAGDYYLLPKKRMRETIIDTYIYKVQGKDVLMSSLVVPITNSAGAFIGISGIDVDLQSVQKLVSAVTLFRSGTLTLYSASQTVAGARDASLLGKNAADFPDGKALQDYLAKGQSFFIQRTLQNGQSVFTGGEPQPIGSTGDTWMVVVDVPTAEVLAPATELLRAIIIIGVIAVAFIAGALILLLRSITVPLATAVALANSISAGDLTRSVGAVGTDETGKLLTAMRHTVEKLREVVLNVKSAADNVASGSGQLSGARRR